MTKSCALHSTGVHSRSNRGVDSDSASTSRAHWRACGADSGIPRARDHDGHRSDLFCVCLCLRSRRKSRNVSPSERGADKRNSWKCVRLQVRNTTTSSSWSRHWHSSCHRSRRNSRLRDKVCFLSASATALCVAAVFFFKKNLFEMGSRAFSHRSHVVHLLLSLVHISVTGCMPVHFDL